MASNVADMWLWFPSTVRTSAVGLTTSLTTGVVQAYPIPSRVQVKQFGIIAAVKFPTFTVVPIIKLQKVGGTDYATTTDLATLTLGISATTYFSSIDRSAVAAGGPGTLYLGPGLAGNLTAITASAQIIAGTVLLASDSKFPSVMIQPGELLQVNVTTAGTTAGTDGQYNAFVRLEVAGEAGLELLNVAQDTA